MGEDIQAIERLRKTADGLQNQIDAKRSPATAEQNYTPRRARIMEGMRRAAERLEQIQTQLRALADLHERGEVPELLQDIISKAQIESLRFQDYPTENYDKGGPARLKKAGITAKNYDKAKQALEQLSVGVVGQQEAQREQGRLKQRIQQIEYTKSGKEFFQTPEVLAERMVVLADIKPGMSVLEPSAGAGAIARQINQAEPLADITTVEINPQLAAILREQGFQPQEGNFLETAGAYDRIVMNPPFSKDQDVAHVRHAYDLLKPGGRLVTLMSPHSFFATDKRSQAFREWAEDKTESVEDLPAKTFEQTGVASKLVVLTKPAEAEPLPQGLTVLREAGPVPARLEDISFEEADAFYRKVLLTLSLDPARAFAASCLGAHQPPRTTPASEHPTLPDQHRG